MAAHRESARPHLSPSWTSAGVGLGVFALGAALRVWNAFWYPTSWGFDARFNWEYIELLKSSWALPAPDATWAAAHPPLFYYLSTALWLAIGGPDQVDAVAAIRLLSAASGLLAIAAAVWLVLRCDPGNGSRAVVAALLLLFLPVHVYMSAMLNEEVLTSALISFSIVAVALTLRVPQDGSRALWTAAGIGALAGLAWLTKLTGVLVAAAVVGAYLIEGVRAGETRKALSLGVSAGLAALAVGGWFYVRNLIGYGYLYPHALPVHEAMLNMPPGERGWFDYVYFPLATFRDPILLAPDLLHSVWGSTYATIWYDGHRFFLPRMVTGVREWGTWLLVLGVVPTVAFVSGSARALRRALRAPAPVDTPLLLLIAATLAGYVFFTLRNPWFAAVKGSYLLGLSVPFAFYASEELSRWTRTSRVRAAALGVWLALLVGSVIVVFAFAVFFRKAEAPGLFWLGWAAP